MSQYLSNNKSSLFSVEDDVDDDEFLRHSPSGQSGYMINIDGPRPRPQSNDFQDLHQQHLDKQREIQSRIVQASQRSLGLLRDSEEIGVSTGEELMRQREQLEGTEKRLDDINATLRISQKHIQGIKSVFGSFKNYLSGKTGETTTNRSNIESPASNSSRTWLDAVDPTRPLASSSTQDHPGLRVRGLGAESTRKYDNPKDPAKQIDENLDEMVKSISRLKVVASGLGEEIESQNELVERVLTKTDRADISLQRQNKDMNRLLK